LGLVAPAFFWVGGGVEKPKKFPWWVLRGLQTPNLGYPCVGFSWFWGGGRGWGGGFFCSQKRAWCPPWGGTQKKKQKKNPHPKQKTGIPPPPPKPCLGGFRLFCGTPPHFFPSKIVAGGGGSFSWVWVFRGGVLTFSWVETTRGGLGGGGGGGVVTNKF